MARGTRACVQAFGAPARSLALPTGLSGDMSVVAMVYGKG